jgi:hypothetical protein
MSLSGWKLKLEHIGQRIVMSFQQSQLVFDREHQQAIRR